MTRTEKYRYSSKMWKNVSVQQMIKNGEYSSDQALFRIKV